MKIKFFTLLAGIVMLGFLISSCSEDSILDPNASINSKLSFVVNGGGYSNQTITFDKTGAAIYASSGNLTSCTFSDNNNNSSVLSFEGNSTGTYPINAKNSFSAILDNSNIIFNLLNGTITVSKFGNIAGEVSGSFSGTGIVTKNASTMDTVIISNGSFKTRRAL